EDGAPQPRKTAHARARRPRAARRVIDRRLADQSLDCAAVDKAVLDELTELLRIPSISADPGRAGDVLRAAEWVRDYVRRGGGEAEVLDWEGSPLVAGEIPASSGAGSAPTILVYGHFDVQPPDPLDLWESPPFEPSLR